MLKKRGTRRSGVKLKRGYLKNRGQIWVETVIYTLIAFALIGLVLAFVKPRIEEIRDKRIIDQSIEVLNEIDIILKNMGAAGNQRVIDLGINKGTLTIDGETDKLFFTIESRQEYSQPGRDVVIGNIIVRTEKKGGANEVTLTRDYAGQYNIKYQNTDAITTISQSPTPYKILVANTGEDIEKKIIFNIQVTN